MVTPVSPNQPDGLHPAVKRLEQGVRDFIQLGASSHLSIEPEEVIEVLVRVQEGRRAPADPVTPEAFFLEALEEEVIQLRENTFEEVELDGGKTEMRPLSDATWNACLRLLIVRFQSELSNHSDS